ncbi:MAG: FAD-dependent oxidoreductase, partial [Proteobacteria bacterium]|nr:FAD-dependent oxidoreductase [Pseudomonadota bacterium]
MRIYNCDILIVGAGPAGSTSALTAARKGLRVLMVERRAKVGTPVQCAEYIPAPLLGEVDLGRNFVVQPIRGMRTFLPGGEIKKMLAPGFTIRRDSFDQTLADAAREAGAEILLSTRALSRNKNEVLLKGKNGLPLKVKPTVII